RATAIAGIATKLRRDRACSGTAIGATDQKRWRGTTPTVRFTQSGHPPFSVLPRHSTMPCPESPGKTMRRREFITLVGGAAAWPITLHAQQAMKISRIGVLMPGRAAQSDVSLTILNAFIPALHELGYTDGQNVAIERKFAEWDANKL